MTILTPRLKQEIQTIHLESTVKTTEVVAYRHAHHHPGKGRNVSLKCCCIQNGWASFYSRYDNVIAFSFSYRAEILSQN